MIKRPNLIGMVVFGIAGMVFLTMVFFGIVITVEREMKNSRIEQWCLSQGGHSTEQYRSETTCWSDDGRRIFP